MLLQPTCTCNWPLFGKGSSNHKRLQFGIGQPIRLAPFVQLWRTSTTSTRYKFRCNLLTITPTHGSAVTSISFTASWYFFCESMSDCEGFGSDTGWLWYQPTTCSSLACINFWICWKSQLQHITCAVYIQTMYGNTMVSGGPRIW